MCGNINNIAVCSYGFFLNSMAIRQDAGALTSLICHQGVGVCTHFDSTIPIALNIVHLYLNGYLLGKNLNDQLNYLT